MLDVTDLRKSYMQGKIEVKALDGVSFRLEQGDFIALTGPSGSGKSTLMHILGLLDRATSGHYGFDGREVTTLHDNELATLRNEKIGFVFQAFNLLTRTSVLDNVKLPLTYAGPELKSKLANNKKDWINRRAKEVLESVGLGHRLDYYTNQISGGEKQRVEIARALVNKPSIIFADEPTGNLDSKSGVQIMKILQDLNDAGNTIVLVTHELYTSEHAKRIIKIVDGHIVEDRPVLNRRFASEVEVLK